MSKIYLAVKGVDDNLCSAWIKHPLLRTQYVIGQRAVCPHPSLPFFIANPKRTYYPLTWKDPNKFNTGCYESKYLLIKVKEEDIADCGDFFLTFSDVNYYRPKTLKGCIEETHFYQSKNEIFASALEPIEVWDGRAGQGKPGELERWIEERANHYGLEVLKK